MPTYIGVNSYAFQQNVTLDVTSVGAGATTAETFSVPGLVLEGGPVVVNKITSNAGLALIDYRVSANDTLELTFQNSSGDAIDPASQTFRVVQL